MQHRWRSTPTNRKVPSLPRSRRVSWSNGWRSVDRQTEWQRQAGLSLNKDELQTQPILNFLGSDSSPSDQTINRLPQSPISPLVPQHGRSTGTLPISEASQVGLSERTPPFSFSLDILLIRLIRSPLFLPVCSCFFHSFWWFQSLYPIPRPSPGPRPGCIEEFADEAQLREGGHHPGVARHLPGFFGTVNPPIATTWRYVDIVMI